MIKSQQKARNLVASEFARQLPEKAFTFSLNRRETIESDFFRRHVGRHAVRYLVREATSRQLKSMLNGVVWLQLNKPYVHSHKQLSAQRWKKVFEKVIEQFLQPLNNTMGVNNVWALEVEVPSNQINQIKIYLTKGPHITSW